MSTDTKIEWTEKTWNPVRGCSVVSPGCVNCYAMKQAHRFQTKTIETALGPSKVAGPFAGLTKQTKAGPQWTGKVVTVESALLEPLSWRKPQRVFVNSMSDLFHEDVPFEFIDKVWDVMWQTPRHTYQILTKRPERMVEYVRTRAAHRAFGWTDKGRPAMYPGDFFSLEEIRMRNMCGYVGDAEWACDHKNHGGVEDSCSEYECPIALRVDERHKLREIGVEDEHTYGSDGYAEDSQWMELTGRPLHAAAGNVWLGFSAEDQKHFDEMMRIFRPLRWILGPHFTLFASLEPLLGPINFTIRYWPENEPNAQPWNALETYDFSDGGGPCHRPYLDWVIVGGESGPGARPCDLSWIRGIVEQCHAARVPVFVKQLGAKSTYQRSRVTLAAGAGVECEHGYDVCPKCDAGTVPLRDRKGGDPEEWPDFFRRREFPEVRR